MAEFPPALNWVLDFEDPRREYEDVPDAGGRSIAGINSRAWPHWYSMVLATAQNERAAPVSDFYVRNFWRPMNLAPIYSQDLVDRVFDAGVNMGAVTAVKLLQRALGVAADGKLGPVTMAVLNLVDPGAMLDTFRQFRVHEYKALVAAAPEKAEYLEAWLKRAEA